MEPLSNLLIPSEICGIESAEKAAKTHKPDTSSINIAADECWKMIAVAAYHKVERREFAPGGELQDWDEAEKEVDKLLYE
jgi:hypothetical protein